jgi:hypothetical protein
MPMYLDSMEQVREKMLNNIESVSILSLALLLLSRDDLQSPEFVTAMTVATG